MATYLDHLNQTPCTIEPGQPVEIVPFQPRYAEAFARCYHQVYRDTFPMKYVYEPGQVCAAVERGDLLSFLAVTPRGEVVGLTSAFHFGPNRRAWEVGGTMVIEAYRKGDIARPLIEQILGGCRASQPDALYGTTVCNHIYTQFAGRKSGFRPGALDLDGFVNFEGAEAVETSILFLFTVYNREPRTLHLPARYAGIAREIFQVMQVERTLVSADAAPTGASVVQVQPLSRSLRLTVATIGADLPAVVAAALAGHPPSPAVQICLPLEQAAAPWAADWLRAAGFFFGGILPLWAESDCLVLQRTLRPPAFEKIALYDPFAKRLLAFIREDRTAVAGP